MTAVILSVLGLAVIDSINPSIIGVTLFLLLRGHNRKPSAVDTKTRSTSLQVLVYLSAVAGTYFVLGVLLMLGLGAISSGLGDALQSPAAYAVTGVLGLAMFVWSWVDSSKDKKDPHRHDGRASRLPTTDNPAALFSLGLVISLLEFSTALPFLASVGLMTTNGVAVGIWLPLLAVYVLIMVLPELLLLVGYRMLSAKMHARLERLRQKMAKNARKTVQWIVAIVGFLLVRDAVFFFAVEFGWYVPNSRK
jgi:cytochrome c biogenesis protein CcdA